MRNPIEVLEQQQAVAPDRDDLLEHPYGRRILRSWFLSRLAVGVLGIAMPFVLVVGDVLFLGDSAWARGSLSAYYHSGVRDVFVGVLCVVGVFLMTYRLSDGRHPDNWLSTVAGAAALVVAAFPTATSGDEVPTSLQTELGESLVARVHFGAAAVFLLALAAVSYLFARRDGARRRPAYARLHRACAAIMLVACIGFAVLAVIGVDKAAGFGVLLLAEVVSTLAFGVSWLAKGIELRRALAERMRTAAPVAAAVPAQPVVGR